ncbi:hypothetical protein RSOL_389520 [Rhizoctonia solani AG-3 Rhs1AP]|uniref:Transmembrane protein n=1 Tax=Rhizoctonia solani AG-3 Rhs1AP TaxID=1086054 RepID=X8JC89_9AGAM|nr:hypothetical protein RSOL_389520 [Rhizoctonia solani AG-3 Rhs1AP]
MSLAIVGACLVSCFVSATNPWFYTSTCGQNGCPICHKAASRGRAEVGARAEDIRQSGRTKRFWKCGQALGQDDPQNNPMAERQTSTEPYQGTEPMQIPEGDKEKGPRDPSQIQWPEVVQVPGGVPKAPPSVLSSGTISSIYPTRPVLDEAISWERLNRADKDKERERQKWWYMP